MAETITSAFYMKRVFTISLYLILLIINTCHASTMDIDVRGNDKNIAVGWWLTGLIKKQFLLPN